MIRINIFFNQGKTMDGRTFKVPHTTDFGYNMSVQLNGNMKSQIQYDNENQTYFIVYDPIKAGVKINQNGYLTLHITD